MTKLRVSPALALPEDTVTSTLIVYGGKGMGKTNFGSVLVEELSRAKLRWSFLDPMGVAWGLRYSADGRGPGVECVILGGPHGDMPIEPTGGAVIADFVVDEDVNVLIDFSRKPSGDMWSNGERIRFVTDYTRRLFSRQGQLVNGRRREPLFQILDEAARYIPQVIPAGRSDAFSLADCLGAWEQAVEEGRNIGLGVGLLTQRSARINKSVAELADAMIAFRTVGPNSIEAVTDWLGSHVEKSRIKELTGQVRALPVGTALVVSPGWLAVEKVVPFRERQTFDSSATPKAGERAKKVSGPGAKPDLAKYQERMAATIERAKAEDPRELRKKVAALEKQLAASPARTGEKPAAVDDRAIARATAALTRAHATTIKHLRDALELAMKFIVNVAAQNFDVAGVDPAELEKAIQSAMAKATELIDRKLNARQRDIDAIRKEAARVADRLKRVLAADGEDVVIDVAVTRNEPFSVAAQADGRGAKPKPDRSMPARTMSDAGQSSTLPRGQQKIINALAELEAIGVGEPSRAQLGMFAGYNLTGGTGGQHIADLNELGLVELPNKGAVRLTNSGRAIAAVVDPPTTLDELHERMLAKLPPGQRKILEHLISLRGEPISRAELGQAVNYNLTGGTGGQHVADLVTMGAATIPAIGSVAASDILFPEGLR